jgi:hypothetical protein
MPDTGQCGDVGIFRVAEVREPRPELRAARGKRVPNYLERHSRRDFKGRDFKGLDRLLPRISNVKRSPSSSKTLCPLLSARGVRWCPASAVNAGRP